MSKVDDLKTKYKRVNASSFSFFDDSDNTPTKKYLEYYLKIWDTRANSNIAVTKNKIVNAVKEFDKLLPYITTKDIYSSQYNQLNRLIDTVNKAEELREQKTFDKNDHIVVINETETYLLLSPKTFRGSTKYGSNTRWCTTTKGYESHFNSYKKGFLVYLIDKTGKRKTNYEKIAFHADANYLPCDAYSTYNANDTSIRSSHMLLNGWTRDEVFEIDHYYKQFIKYVGDLRIAKDEVEKVIDFMKTVDLEKFQENLAKLKIESTKAISEVGTTIKKFNEQFSTFAISDLIKD